MHEPVVENPKEQDVSVSPSRKNLGWSSPWFFALRQEYADEEERRKALFVVWASLAMGIAAIVGSSIMLLHNGRLSLGLSILFCAGWSFLFYPTTMRVLSVQRAGEILCLMGFVLLLVLSLISYGVHTLSLKSLPFIAILGLFLGSARFGAWLAVASTLVVWGLFALHVMGHSFPLAIHAPFVYTLGAPIAYTLLFFLGWVVVRYYDQSRTEAHRLARNMLQEVIVARDAAEQANQTKSQFLANVSHELRTPLNAILGYAELLDESLEDSPPIEQTRPDLRRIQDSAKHLLSLLNELLDLSKIEAGRLEFHFEPLELAPFVERLEEEFEFLATKNDNAFRVSCDKDVGVVWIDPLRLRQILNNLLSNACKFTHQGTIELEVRRLSQRPHDWVTFCVRDSGIGIPAQKQRSIFQPFTQAERDTAQKYGGTGLGLAISRQLAAAMGGDILLESEPGKGSCFILRVPARSL